MSSDDNVDEEETPILSKKAQPNHSPKLDSTTKAKFALSPEGALSPKTHARQDESTLETPKEMPSFQLIQNCKSKSREIEELSRAYETNLIVKELPQTLPPTLKISKNTVSSSRSKKAMSNITKVQHQNNTSTPRIRPPQSSQINPPSNIVTHENLPKSFGNDPSKLNRIKTVSSTSKSQKQLQEISKVSPAFGSKSVTQRQTSFNEKSTRVGDSLSSSIFVMAADMFAYLFPSTDQSSKPPEITKDTNKKTEQSMSSKPVESPKSSVYKMTKADSLHTVPVRSVREKKKTVSRMSLKSKFISKHKIKKSRGCQRKKRSSVTSATVKKSIKKPILARKQKILPKKISKVPKVAKLYSENDVESLAASSSRGNSVAASEERREPAAAAAGTIQEMAAEIMQRKNQKQDIMKKSKYPTKK